MQVKISKVMCKSIIDYLQGEKQFTGYRLNYVELKPNDYKTLSLDVINI